jgi:hypothetical protein
MNERQKAALARHAKWEDPLQRIFLHPDNIELCPFCGEASVKANWGVYSRNEKDRLASVDIWCEHCRENMHCACVLPPSAPDTHPPGFVKYEVEMTKRIFGVGEKRGWWRKAFGKRLFGR